MFEKIMLGEYLDRDGRKWQEAEENGILRNFIICGLHQMLGWWNQRGWGGQDMERWDIHSEFWSEDLKKRDT